MSTDKLRRLTNSLSLSHRDSRDRSEEKYRTQSFLERERSRRNYVDFSNNSNDEKKEGVLMSISARRPNWKQDHYRVRDLFGRFHNNKFEPFPHNNDKYNVQFLERSLRGRSLKMPAKDLGFFQNPQDSLLTEHYKPIVNEKRNFNQTYELRTSLYGDTWVDEKRDRIMDEYKLQANPFRTPQSNAIIATMRRQRARQHKF